MTAFGSDRPRVHDYHEARHLTVEQVADLCAASPEALGTFAVGRCGVAVIAGEGGGVAGLEPIGAVPDAQVDPAVRDSSSLPICSLTIPACVIPAAPLHCSLKCSTASQTEVARAR